MTMGATLSVALALVTVAGLPALIPFPSGEDLLVLAVRWPLLLLLNVGVLSVLVALGARIVTPGNSAHPAWGHPGVAALAGGRRHFLDLCGELRQLPSHLRLWLYNSAQILVLRAAINAELEFPSKDRSAAPGRV